MGWERMALYPGERCLNGCYQIPLFGEKCCPPRGNCSTQTVRLENPCCPGRMRVCHTVGGRLRKPVDLRASRRIYLRARMRKKEVLIFA